MAIQTRPASWQQPNSWLRPGQQMVIKSLAGGKVCRSWPAVDRRGEHLSDCVWWFRGSGFRRALVESLGNGRQCRGCPECAAGAAALSHCRMYVGNDTGTMHLAAAVRIPCVAIMSALDWPGHWSPYGSGHTVLRRHVPCEGCMLSVCTTEGLRCLKEIGTEEVVSASLQTLMRPETTVNNPFADRERRSLASLPVGF